MKPKHNKARVDLATSISLGYTHASKNILKNKKKLIQFNSQDTLYPSNYKYFEKIAIFMRFH